MTVETVFQLASTMALIGWLILAGGVLFRLPMLRDVIVGRWIVLGLSTLYAVLIAFFFFKAPGGFDSLANVKLLFTSDWAALAGWIHYLAFDLFMGAWIARHSAEAGLPRWPLIAILPLTFLFGPVGYLTFEITKLLLSPSNRTKDA